MGVRTLVYSYNEYFLYIIFCIFLQKSIFSVYHLNMELISIEIFNIIVERKLAQFGR